jgi:hypothetical protein
MSTALTIAGTETAERNVNNETTLTKRFMMLLPHGFLTGCLITPRIFILSIEHSEIRWLLNLQQVSRLAAITHDLDNIRSGSLGGRMDDTHG